MSNPPAVTAKRILAEVTVTYTVVSGLAFAITRLRAVRPFADYVAVGVAFVFVMATIGFARREQNGEERFGISLGGVLAPVRDRTWSQTARAALTESAFAVLVMAIVFPLYAFGFLVWNQPVEPFTLRAPPGVLEFILGQIVVIGFAEEAFFRGYLQTRLTDAWPSQRKILGAGLSIRAWVAQAALFGLIHFVVDLHPARLATFFPGLLFGWIRAHRGGIGAAIVVHAMSNLLSELLARGWLL